MLKGKTTAEKLIHKFQTNDPFIIAEKVGIITIFERLGNNLGYFNKYKKFKMIHINQDITKFEQRFVCAHELGHAILHPNINTPFLKRCTLFSISKIEREANTFAVELLLPDYLLQKYPDCGFYNIARIVGIPEKLTVLKQK